MKRTNNFLKMNIQSQAKIFNAMAENVKTTFPKDIKAQAVALGKAFDKMTGKRSK